MRERNVLDDVDDIAQLVRMTPEQRFALGLELSELALALARANPAGPRAVSDSLEEKASRWTLRRIGSTA